MNAEKFYLELKDQGIDFGAGVPCAVLKGVLKHLMNDPEMTYIQAAREEDAVGIAAGAYLAGKHPIVLMQNSGLANCINAIASLCIPYKIPIVFLVSWRGCPEDENEVPYHYLSSARKPLASAMGMNRCR